MNDECESETSTVVYDNQQVLERVVQEFGEDLVRATLCLIENSHYGLEEEELLHLLTAQPVLPTSPNDCSPSDFKNKLPMAAVSGDYDDYDDFDDDVDMMILMMMLI